MDEKLIKATLEYGRRRFSEEHWDTGKSELDFMAEEVWRLVKDRTRPTQSSTGQKPVNP